MTGLVQVALENKGPATFRLSRPLLSHRRLRYLDPRPDAFGRIRLDRCKYRSMVRR